MGARKKVDLKTAVEFSRIVDELSKIQETLNEKENEFVKYHKSKIDEKGSEIRISPRELIWARSMYRIKFTMTYSTTPENEASIIRQETKKLNRLAYIRRAKRARNYKNTRRKQKLNFPKWNLPGIKPESQVP
jgi:hypothetical protein